MFVDMFKGFWESSDWKGKLFILAIPVALLVYANTTFAPPNCDHHRRNLALADQPNNPYRQTQVFHSREFLRECELGLAARQRQAAADRVDPYWVRQRVEAQSMYATTWVIGVFILLPLGILLSYAAAAGRWGNAAYVKWTDFYGTPLATFFAVWSFFHGAAGVALLHTGVAASQGFQAFLVGSAIFAFLFALPAALFLTRDFIEELWTMTKGLFMLLHYMFTSHPAEIHLPSHPEVAISRPALREAITTHYAQAATSTGGFWSFLKPCFMYEHELFRANKVEELLRADVSILQEAIRRERARTEAADLKQK